MSEYRIGDRVRILGGEYEIQYDSGLHLRRVEIGTPGVPFYANMPCIEKPRNGDIWLCGEALYAKHPTRGTFILGRVDRMYARNDVKHRLWAYGATWQEPIDE